MAVIRYERGADGVVRESVSNDGGKTFTETGTGKVTSGNTGTSQYGYSSGNNQYTGKTGKQYNVSGANGAITVNRPDGTISTVQRGDANYQATLDAMQKDGVDYTPNTTYTNQNGTYTTKSYTAGNSDLQYAMQQAAKTNPGISVSDYAESLWNRVGTTRADGTVVTTADVNKELDRLGLSDYNSQNAVYTAGQNLLPGNEFGRYGEDANGDEGQWYFYGGQQYRVGGDQADFVEYVNGKTGNLNNNLSYIFGDMANNPYAQQDPEFMQQYLQGQTQFNDAAYPSTGVTGTTGGTTGTNGSYTGNANVDGVIDYIGSVQDYINSSGGGSGTTNLLDMIQGILDNGLQVNQDFLAQQRAYAEQQAQKQASDAFVNKTLAGDAAKEQLSALGLGTTGALQSAMMGVQGDYSNNLATIQQNLYTMLNGLSEQELQILTDYYNNSAQYNYQVATDEMNREMQKAQLALQLQQAQYDQEYQKQQLAMQQAQWDWQQKQADQQYAWEQQQYKDTMTQQQFNNDITLKELLLRQQAQEFDNDIALKELLLREKALK